MGQEAQCTAWFEGRLSEGKARLEPDSLLFRGDFRLSIPLKELKSADAKKGQLIVKFSEGVVTFDLGPLAEKWARKIQYPKSLIEKLGVKPDSKVVVLSVDDKNFWQQLKERATKVSKGKPQEESDLIFLSAEVKEDLAKIERLKKYIKKNGAIWVVAPKGKNHIKESDVIAAGKEAGLVDTKVVSFSETHTAHKLVIPVASR